MRIGSPGGHLARHDAVGGHRHGTTLRVAQLVVRMEGEDRRQIVALVVA